MAVKQPPRTASIVVPRNAAVARSRTPALVGVLLAVAAYAGLCAALWRTSGRGSDAFVMVPQAITDAQAPDWLPAAEVARVNDLASAVQGRSILDPTLADDLAACYAESPWVSHTLHIRRAYPDRLEVALAIRRPIAVVDRASGPPIVLDRAAVRLPASAAPDGLPRLEGVATPPPAIGEPWAGGRAADGLRVLARYGTLADRVEGFERFEARKVLVGEWSRQDARPVVEIRTAAGFPIVWGIDLPGGEASVSEPSAEQKLAMLAEALPRIGGETRKIAYASVRQHSGVVVKFDGGSPVECPAGGSADAGTRRVSRAGGSSPQAAVAWMEPR